MKLSKLTEAEIKRRCLSEGAASRPRCAGRGYQEAVEADPERAEKRTR